VSRYCLGSTRLKMSVPTRATPEHKTRKHVISRLHSPGSNLDFVCMLAQSSTCRKPSSLQALWERDPSPYMILAWRRQSALLITKKIFNQSAQSRIRLRKPFSIGSTRLPPNGILLPSVPPDIMRATCLNNG
jgi:hypothetical protein